MTGLDGHPFWDDHQQDLQDLHYRIAYGYQRKRIRVVDWSVNAFLYARHLRFRKRKR